MLHPVLGTSGVCGTSSFGLVRLDCSRIFCHKISELN